MGSGMTDAELERQIAEAKRELLAAKTSQDRHKAGDRMTALINQRSPEQVKRMERALGL